MDTLVKMWPVFVDPILKGKYKISEFVRIYKENIYLFTGDAVVADRLVDLEAEDLIAMVKTRREIATQAKAYELPIQSKYVLCAAYLASYNPPRYDVRFFSKAKDARAKRRDTGRRKSLKINPRSLAAPAFDLERMLAILHSIIPTDEEEKNVRAGSHIDIGVQIATLTTLKLIIRTSNSDPLDSRTRWKVNASWTLVKRLADDINFPIEEFLLESE
ncbi:origin recognition complex subunit 5 [Sugiyamaella lignohabitans]|uniref:Origin recognition complex subunit 5 n=1 Tax=Sugiyamaella lignohabitans TaxID=796027 RepID=A0A167C375_9ASCO|nr:origin recognition complex subunit 5 [Sugiyamaella lignohabitans]ANB11164.1 origin recognition complex subunit 5 [Sugiyamaella lignohabitans]